MEFKLQFNMDNAAFEEDDAGEVGKILEKVADDFISGLVSGGVRDSNGNTVGTWEIKGY